MPKTDRIDITLEKFLAVAGLVSDRDLAEMAVQSSKTGLPLGRTLVLSRLIKEKDLEQLLKLLAIQHGCNLSMQVVLDAYQYAVKHEVPVEEALAKVGIFAQIVSYSRLGTLLVDANLISKDQLDESQKLAYETRLPLGKMLTMHGAITPAQLTLALDLQRQLRDRTMTKDEALTILSGSMPKVAVSATVKSGEQATSIPVASDSEVSDGAARKINLGELLLISGAVSEADVDAAFQLSLKSKQKLQDILLERGLASASLIEIALELQQAVNSGDLCLAAAAESISYIAEHQ